MVNFGILGAGNIAHRFAASLAHEQDARLVAVSCRSEQKAAAWVAEQGIAAQKAYAGTNAHELLLADPDVDAIYLALPHQLHYEWACKALEAGKAVLCEKPAMLSAWQMEKVARIARSRGVLFMEAMKPRFVALYQQVVEAIGQIGRIERVEATLCNDMLSLVEGGQTYHVNGGPGAGVALDCGIYCASWLEAWMPGEPVMTDLVGSVVRDGVDLYVDAHFAAGRVQGRLECAFDRAKPRTATITGSEGLVVVEELHRPQRAVLRLADGTEHVMEAPYVHDDFYGEIHHFCELLREGATESPIMPLDASIGCARIIDAVLPRRSDQPRPEQPGFFDVVRERHSYRGGFLPEPVPREDLARIMEAGLAAPSGCNKQTTSLVAIDDSALLERLRAQIDPPLKNENAPAAICVLTRRVNAYRDKCFAVQDYAAAIQNMLLAATALGYASCWYEGHITDDDRLCDRMAQVLGVPDDLDLVCYLPIGRPVHAPRGPRKLPFSDRAWFNAYEG